MRATLILIALLAAACADPESAGVDGASQDCRESGGLVIKAAFVGIWATTSDVGATARRARLGCGHSPETPTG